jgi:transcriptional regulator with XRE-family HTH domain
MDYSEISNNGKRGVMNKLAVYLRKLRGDLTMRQLADETGVSNAYLSLLESGKRESPSLAVLQKLAQYYRLPLVELLEAGGYLTQNDEMVISMADQIEKAFLRVISDPRLEFGSSLKNKYDWQAQRFIVEMYEKFTGEKLLAASQCEDGCCQCSREDER